MTRMTCRLASDLTGLAEVVPDAELASFDLDRTLTGYRDETFDPAILDMIGAIASSGVSIALVSNAHGERAKRVLRLADQISSSVNASCDVVVPDDAGGRIKPDPAMFRVAAERAGVSVEHCVHVGDQMLKDIVGAERAGYAATVLVAPLGAEDHLGVKLLQRPLEFVLRPFYGYPLMTRNFPVALTIVRGGGQ